METEVSSTTEKAQKSYPQKNYWVFYIIFRNSNDAPNKNSEWLNFNEGWDPLLLSDRFGLVHTLVQYVNHNYKEKPSKKYNKK